jgi:hypothetical protein
VLDADDHRSRRVQLREEWEARRHKVLVGSWLYCNDDDEWYTARDGCRVCGRGRVKVGARSNKQRRQRA